MAVFKHLQLFESFMTADPSLTQHIGDMLTPLSQFRKVLFLTTSSRYIGEDDVAKSTMVARYLHDKLPNSTLIDVTSLKIHMCEGNVSSVYGNKCGLKDSLLKDPVKNPSNQHRCWASYNNPDDELWKVSKELLESDCVIFFASVRWGQTNAVYQKLIERLTWLENRHTTLNENNIISNIQTGLVLIGQNWNGHNVLTTQRDVLNFFGFKTEIDSFFWNWQFTQDVYDESNDSYKDAARQFGNSLNSI